MLIGGGLDKGLLYDQTLLLEIPITNIRNRKRPRSIRWDTLLMQMALE